MRFKLIITTLFAAIGSVSCLAQTSLKQQNGQHRIVKMPVSMEAEQNSVIVGAARFEAYLPKLQGKRVALLVNQTSMIGATHLVDTLRSLQVEIIKIFSPEHGFRGSADAGAKVSSSIDAKTGLPIISLYGKNKKPTKEQLADVDIVLYDLQDVGVRFYTYISSLEYLMEACGEFQKPLIVLDRPNPLGNVVDGPVLDKKFKSFIGMQSIPVVYGMTVGEYAQLLIGEKWIMPANIALSVVEMQHWNHNTTYDLPVAPSPNLKNMTAVYLYPSLCFFEGTVISLGRGTATPFQMFGHPVLKKAYPAFSFTPLSVEGATNPPLLNQLCYGQLIATDPNAAKLAADGRLQIKWLLDAYKHFPNKETFFNKDNFINLLAGTDMLKKQIMEGKSEEQIRASWEKDLNAFKKIRAQYLLYP
jgi:uncharacterized protein YbbC (DUF1343 family)